MGTKGASKEQEHFQVQADLSTQLARTPPMMLRVQNPNYPPSTWLCTSAYTQGEENKQKEQKDIFSSIYLLTFWPNTSSLTSLGQVGQVGWRLPSRSYPQEHPARCTTNPICLFFCFFFLKARELPAALSSAGAEPLEEAEV